MMCVRVRLDDLASLTPNAADVYLRGIGCLHAVMACFGLLTNATRPAHFLAQVLHESSALRAIEENLHYSAERLMEVWPGRFPTLASAERVAGKPEELANAVYGDRPELGNLAPGDGWAYRGRGLLQITGRHNYRVVGRRLDIDLLTHPDLAASETYAWPVAAAVWTERGGNRLADLDDLRGVTKAIAGGYAGLVQRRAWLEKARRLVESI